MYSSSLGRQASYTQRSRLSRLPTYLTVHIDRFAQGGDSNERAKIMVSLLYQVSYTSADILIVHVAKSRISIRIRRSRTGDGRAEGEAHAGSSSA